MRGVTPRANSLTVLTNLRDYVPGELQADDVSWYAKEKFQRGRTLQHGKLSWQLLVCLSRFLETKISESDCEARWWIIRDIRTTKKKKKKEENDVLYIIDREDKPTPKLD